MTFERLKVGEIANFFNNSRKPVTKKDRKPGAIPYYGANGIQDYVAEHIFDGHYVLVGEDGTVLQPGGKPTLQNINGKSWVNNHAHVIATNNDDDTDFLFYSLGNEDITAFVTGAVQMKLNMGNLKDVEIYWPSEQNTRSRIVQVLRQIDEKIELNRKTSVHLEQIAQTIFKSWFVDFDPVHAKARGEQPAGMDAETAALFPDAFEDSELGPIPAGWKLGVIGDLGRIITGKTPSTKKPQYWSDGTYPFITIPDLHESRFPVRTQRFVSQTGSSSQPTTKLPPYSVVVSCIATAGLIGLTTVESHTNQQINAVVVEEKENAFWVLNKLIALSPEIRNQSAIGTVFPNLSKRGFSEIRIVIPPLPLIEEYSESISSFVEMQIHLESESAKLAEIRDLLLPRLISGELEIPEELLGE